jgi:hypothetical protein
VKFEAASDFPYRTTEAPTQNIRERNIFDSNDNLATRPANGRKDFDKIQRPVIVDMLDRIVQQE